jgi:hypothetical protein
MAVVLPQGRQHFDTITGTPGVGYQLYAYIPGTSTPKDTYTDSTELVQNAHPVIADSRGDMRIYWSGSYDVVLKDENDVLIWGPERLVETASEADLVDLEARLADTSNVSHADAMIGVLRSDMGSSIATTQHLINKSLPVYADSMFGVVTGVVGSSARTANGVAINAALVAAGLIGGYVVLPAGIIEYSGTLIPQLGVNMVGAGMYATVLTYYGSGVAVNAVGTSPARKVFTWSDMTLSGTSGATQEGIQLGWNHRSLPLFKNVEVCFFGLYGLNFVDESSIVYFRDCNIHDNGTVGTNGAGVKRLASLEVTSDIRFIDCAIEANGTTATSTAGGVLWIAPTLTQGLWFQGGDIEGNFGSSEVYIEKADHVVFDDVYIEANKNGGTNRCGIICSATMLSVTNCRVTSEAGNTSGSAIYALAGSQVHVSGNSWDGDFGSADVRLDASRLSGSDVGIYGIGPMRVLRDNATATLTGGMMQAAAWGRFDGKTGAAATRTCGENFATCVRNATGDYSITFVKPMPTTNYIVIANAEDGSTYSTQIAAARPIVSASTFDIYVTDSTDTKRDGRTVSFVVYCMTS